MSRDDLLYLGLKRRVSAVSRRDGSVQWSTKLPSGMGDFVTLHSDRDRLCAYCGGHLHALDFISGAILWTNHLPGLGYGLGSLHLHGFGSAPTSETAAAHAAAAAASSAATVGTSN